MEAGKCDGSSSVNLSSKSVCSVLAIYSLSICELWAVFAVWWLW
jgi:hypothetical protein